MGPRTKKVVLRKTPLTYEQHYSLLYKYPRKSIINEYYIKNKYLHRIRLSSDIDGLNRLRDRTRRINYFEDSLANRTVNSDSDNNLIYRSRNTFKNRKPKGNKGSRSRTASPKKKKRKIMGDGTANNSSNNTPRFQRHQNRLFLAENKNSVLSTVPEKPTELNKASSLKLEKIASSSMLFDYKQLPKEPNDILFVDGESSDSEDEIKQKIFNTYKSIKITLKEIKQISSGHRCLTQRFSNKRNYCSICDIKLNNYIIQKKILSFNISNTLSCVEDDDINVILPDVTVENGFKLRYPILKRDFFTYRTT